MTVRRRARALATRASRWLGLEKAPRRRVRYFAIVDDRGVVFATLDDYSPVYANRWARRYPGSRVLEYPSREALPRVRERVSLGGYRR